MSLLPEKKTEPVTDLTGLKTLLYGSPKIGKSTFCSTMNAPLFLATEQGLGALSVYKVDIPDWNTLLEVGKELSGSNKYKTIVLDTVDNAYQFCLEAVCKKHGIQHPQDLDYGKGWGLVNHEFQRVLTKLSHQHRGFVLVSHAKIETIKTRTSEITRAVPTIPGSARRFIIGLVDVILYAEATETEKGVQRVLHAMPSESWEAGDRTGKLPETMPLDYKAVAKAFKSGGK